MEHKRQQAFTKNETHTLVNHHRGACDREVFVGLSLKKEREVCSMNLAKVIMMKSEPTIDNTDMVRSETLMASFCWAVQFGILTAANK